LLIYFYSKSDLNGDNASYLRLARNLSQGAGYVEKMQDQITSASHFPPRYPFFSFSLYADGSQSVDFFQNIEWHTTGCKPFDHIPYHHAINKKQVTGFQFHLIGRVFSSFITKPAIIRY
jgi:hypothetical protein